MFSFIAVVVVAVVVGFFTLNPFHILILSTVKKEHGIDLTLSFITFSKANNYSNSQTEMQISILHERGKTK